MRRIPPATAAVAVMILAGAGLSLADTPGTVLTVTPSTNLNPAGQTVSVSGTGFGPNGSGTIQQCIPIDDIGTEACSQNLATFTTNASGAFGPVNVNVTQTFTAEGQTRTCSAATPCSLYAAMNAQPQDDHAPISFSASTTTTSTTTTSTSTTSTSTTSTSTSSTTSTTSTSTTSTSTTSSTTSTTAPTTTSSSTTSTTANPLICDGKTATIVGTRSSDVIIGTAGPDVIVGLGGDDVIRGLGGDDTICGGSGNDNLDAGEGNDRLFGGDGNDRLLGGTGTNNLFGESGADQCFVTPTSTASTCEQVVAQP